MQRACLRQAQSFLVGVRLDWLDVPSAVDDAVSGLVHRRPGVCRRWALWSTWRDERARSIAVLIVASLAWSL